MGEFDLVKEIIEKFGEPAKIAKAQVDKLVDMAAPPPVGTGVENIREMIMMNKMTFDVSSDEWQVRTKEILLLFWFSIILTYNLW